MQLLASEERSVAAAECELSFLYNAQEQARLARLREEAAWLARCDRLVPRLLVVVATRAVAATGVSVATQAHAFGVVLVWGTWAARPFTGLAASRGTPGVPATACRQREEAAAARREARRRQQEAAAAAAAAAAAGEGEGT